MNLRATPASDDTTPEIKSRKMTSHMLTQFDIDRRPGDIGFCGANSSLCILLASAAGEETYDYVLYASEPNWRRESARHRGSMVLSGRSQMDLDTVRLEYAYAQQEAALRTMP